MHCLELRMKEIIEPEIQPREAATPEVGAALTEYENRFAVQFTRYAVFPKEFLTRLHETSTGLSAGDIQVRIASRENRSLLNHFDVFLSVANSDSPTLEDRSQYLRSLDAVYGALLPGPAIHINDPSVLFVAPEREGRILAQRAGWLPPGHALHPDIKRIPFEGGLIVGLNDLTVNQPFRRAELIDGAIASGATLMAMMEALRPWVQVFDIYSIHATFEAINGLVAFARIRNLELALQVGHATAGLNQKFYAVTADSNGKRVVVGDLGDTISDLREATNNR
jgi:hypothetical protein